MKKINGKTYIFSDFYMVQGHSFISNPWWIGSRECNNISEEIMACNGRDENGNTFKIQFNNLIQMNFLCS